LTVNSQPLAYLGMAAALGCAPQAIHAQTISPVIVELSPIRRVVSITVTNSSEAAVNYQTETLSWSQPDGHDRYEESNDLIVVPPIAEIGSGASQIFRVAMRKPPGPREQAYRLILEDITEEAATAANSATVHIRVRHSLPVFVTAPGTPRMEARVGQCAAPAGTGCARLDNIGARYLTAKSLTIEAGAWKKEMRLGTRVLAGAWREWVFDMPANIAGPLQIRIDTSAGPFAGEISTSRH
jgi:fimbrial chaperone protein